jgi:hypothetical protein
MPLRVTTDLEILVQVLGTGAVDNHINPAPHRLLQNLQTVNNLVSGPSTLGLVCAFRAVNRLEKRSAATVVHFNHPRAVNGLGFRV